MNAILFHTDIRGFAYANTPDLSASGLREGIIAAAFRELDAVSDGREILLPAFNYDFTRTGLFNVVKDLPQVGRVPLEAMSRPGWFRSHSPVYSFLSNQQEPPLSLRPFSEESVFADLVMSDGEIALLGVGFESLTFIHHVEHIFDVPYRYSKSFKGQVLSNGEVYSVTSEFHVRPKGLDISYDFGKIGRALLASSAARISDRGLTLLSARSSLATLLDGLKENPTFLLNSDSAKSVLSKLDSLGRAVQLEDFE